MNWIIFWTYIAQAALALVLLSLPTFLFIFFARGAWEIGGRDTRKTASVPHSKVGA